MSGGSSRLIAIVLLAATVALLGANWAMRPGPAWAWTSVVILCIFMIGVLLFGNRSANTDGRRRRAQMLERSVSLASFQMVVALAMSLGKAAGLIHDPDLPIRITMATIGGVLFMMGNAIPKTFVPARHSSWEQSSDGGPAFYRAQKQSREDTAAAQASYRLVGWTWALTGLAYAASWLVAPLGFATAISLALPIIAMLVIASKRAWLPRTC